MKRSSHACLAGMAAALAAAPLSAPIRAQESIPGSGTPATTETGDPLENLDPLTRAVERNPLTLIRIAALGLKDPAHQGEALSGLVAAFLARDKPDDAAIEMKAITDPLWKACALIHVADDQKKRGRLKTAEDTLGRSLALARGKQIERDGGATVIRISERYLQLRAFQAPPIPRSWCRTASSKCGFCCVSRTRSATARSRH